MARHDHSSWPAKQESVFGIPVAIAAGQISMNRVTSECDAVGIRTACANKNHSPKATMYIRMIMMYLDVGVIDAVVHDAAFVVRFLEQSDHRPRRHVRIQPSGPYLSVPHSTHAHSSTYIDGM